MNPTDGKRLSEEGKRDKHALINSALRQLFWPAAAGNVAWALFTVGLGNNLLSGEVWPRFLILLFLASYLACDWVWTTARFDEQTKPWFWWIEAPFLVVVVALAILTEKVECLEKDVLWLEVPLGGSFLFALLGHSLGAWNKDDKPIWKEEVRRSYRALANERSDMCELRPIIRATFIGINVLGLCVVFGRLFTSVSYLHLPLALFLALCLWLILELKVRQR